MTSPSGPAAVGGPAAAGGTAEADATAPAGVAPGGSAAPGGQAAEGAKPYDRGPVWALLLPPLAALGLALWGIATPSFWRDEAATVSADKRPFADLITMLGHVDAVHGAYYIFMWPLVHMFGSGEVVMRLPSALAAGVTAAFVAAIGRRVVSPWVGLAAGLLFAVLPVASRYGQEARSYEMVVGMAAVASYLLVRVLNADEASRRKWLIWYGASMAVLGILNIFGLLLIPCHLVTVAANYRRRHADATARRIAIGWLVAAVAGVVLSSPLLLLGWQQRGQVAWITKNQSSSGLGTLITLAGSTLVTLVVAGIVAIGLILATDAGGRRRASWRWQLAELSLPWMIVPPALLLGVSTVDPIYTSRYVLMCVPAGALLGGMALVGLGRVAGPVALVLVMLAGFNVQVTQREPYGHYDNVRALDQIVAAHARPGDVVLYTNPNSASFGAAYSYGLGTLPNIQTKEAAIPSGTLAGTWVDLTTLRARLRSVSRVWVVEINHCTSDPQVLTLADKVEGAAIAGLPLKFTRIWHERGDWMLLYTRGKGNQALKTACQGHT